MPRGKAKKNGANGAGTKHIKLDPQSIKTDSKGRLIIDDLVPASVLLMFFIQKLGKPTLDQLVAKVDAAKVVINSYLLEQAVDALQARGFVSYAKGKDETGQVVDTWKPRKVNFAGVPDVAQVTKAFLSELVTTEDAEELISAMNASEEEGDGKAKATEKNKYADFWTCEVTFKTVERDDGMVGSLLGGHPSSPFYDKTVRKGPKCPTKADLRFPRNNKGMPIVPLSNIRGWLKAMLYQSNRPQSIVQYIGIRGGKIEADPLVIDQYSHQVVDLSGSTMGGGGRGITTYEVIEAGATIKFWFTIPARGMFDYHEFVGCLMKYARTSPRGLSNAKSNQHGAVKVIDAKYLGMAGRDWKKGVESVMDQMDPDERALAEKIMAGGKEQAKA